jgi:GNAT superfamily N-acetyltransferase
VIELAHESADMPPPDEVERLYADASAAPPLAEPPSVAGMFARLYAEARGFPGAIAVSARSDGALVGFGYGHPWTWAEATDPWSLQLRERLGTAAGELDDAFAVELLAVAPAASGAGLGRRLLSALLDATGRSVAWLQTTDKETPALRLYRGTGWQPIGHGPDAPDGRPGLVLVHRRSPERP